METIFCLLIGIRLSVEDIRYQSLSIAELAIYTLIALIWKHSLSTHTLIFFGLTILCIYFKFGVGEGDFWLLGIWSFFYDAFTLETTIFLSSLIALFFIFSIYLIFQRKIKLLPFVPFLTLALFLQPFL